MIVRVWGSINSTEVEFSKIPDKPGYWEGIGPRSEDYQLISIWAESSSGAVAHLDFAISMKVYGPDKVRLLLSPFKVSLVEEYSAKLMKEAV